MKNKVQSPFPPDSLSDLARPSADAFVALVKSSRRASATLFLGAGVSASAGLPPWTQLLERVCAAFFWHWNLKGRPDSPPRNVSIASWDAFDWDMDARRLAQQFAVGSPLLVAQQIKDRIRPADWRYLINKVLYHHLTERPTSRLLSALSELCSSDRAIGAVVNYNFDSVFDEQLDHDGVKHTVLFHSRVAPAGLAIVHPHGYLKRCGGPVTPLILGEADYFESSRVPYAWPDALLVAYITTTSCVFVGHSMTDPNVRRLLRIGKAVGIHQHFAFLPQRAARDDAEIRTDALFDKDLLQLGVKCIRYPLCAAADRDQHRRVCELLELWKQLLTTGALEEMILGG